MLMILGVTFLTIFLLFLGLAYLTTGERPVTERLVRVWQQSIVAERFRDRQRKRVESALTKIGDIVPTSPENLSSTQRLMVRAGFRGSEALSIFQGLRIVLPVLLLAIVFATGVYKLNVYVAVLFAVLLGFSLPEIYLTQRIHKRQQRILRGMPDCLDLLVVCVEAGLGLDQALLRVSREVGIAHPDLKDELELVNMEVRLGRTRSDALRDLGIRTGVDEAKSLASMLIQTDRFGTDLAQTLRVQADTLRAKRRQRIEERAAKTSVKMVPALVFLIFPALYIVLLGPAVITLMQTLIPALSH
jgi:tight adherence protein C